MAPATGNPVLFPDHVGLPDGVVVINDRCRFQQRDGYRVVVVSGMPLAHFASGDRVGEAHAMRMPFESADPNLSASDDQQVEIPLIAADHTHDPEGDSGLRTADPNLSASAPEQAQVPFSLDLDPAIRAGDRLLVRLEFVEDAAPIFGAATQLPGVGAPLAMPALVNSGVLSILPTFSRWSPTRQKVIFSGFYHPATAAPSKRDAP